MKRIDMSGLFGLCVILATMNIVSLSWAAWRIAGYLSAGAL